LRSIAIESFQARQILESSQQRVNSNRLTTFAALSLDLNETLLLKVEAF
jgi:hypothetical protein